MTTADDAALSRLRRSGGVMHGGEGHARSRCWIHDDCLHSVDLAAACGPNPLDMQTIGARWDGYGGLGGGDNFGRGDVEDWSPREGDGYGDGIGNYGYQHGDGGMHNCFPGWDGGVPGGCDVDGAQNPQPVLEHSRRA